LEPSIELNDGNKHPLIGYGSYKVGVIPASASAAGGVGSTTGANPKDVVKEALEVGYRFLDCAQFYGNEKDVGAAIKESGIPREELYLASKVWGDVIYEGGAAVKKQFEQTLSDLGTDYLDVYLVHWPVPVKHIEAYQALEELKQAGKVRSIGLSNYTVEDYEELKPHTAIPPAINQIEVNPFLYRKKTIEHFQKAGVAIQAYRPLRQGKALQDPKIMEIAAKYGKTASQVLGRWLLQKQIIYIPKSEKKARMKENAQVLDFELAADDMAQLDTMTTAQALQDFKELYQKCVNRDTPLDGTMDGVKMEITVD